jgi:hypothetical protein
VIVLTAVTPNGKLLYGDMDSLLSTSSDLFVAQS